MQKNNQCKHSWILTSGSACSTTPLGSSLWECSKCDKKERIRGMYHNPDGKVYDPNYYIDNYSRITIEEIKKDIKKEEKMLKVKINKNMSKKSTITDIYEGRELTVWEDDETVTIALNFTTIAIPKENWEDVKKDIKELAKKIK